MIDKNQNKEKRLNVCSHHPRIKYNVTRKKTRHEIELGFDSIPKKLPFLCCVHVWPDDPLSLGFSLIHCTQLNLQDPEHFNRDNKVSQIVEN